MIEYTKVMMMWWGKSFEKPWQKSDDDDDVYDVDDDGDGDGDAAADDDDDDDRIY